MSLEYNLSFPTAIHALIRSADCAIVMLRLLLLALRASSYAKELAGHIINRCHTAIQGTKDLEDDQQFLYGKCVLLLWFC